MTDIVERLRNLKCLLMATSSPTRLRAIHEVMIEAADTIVLLRGDKTQIALSYDQALKEIERLRNEIDRMGMMNNGHR